MLRIEPMVEIEYVDYPAELLLKGGMHKYLRRYRGKSGKWVYVYPKAGLTRYDADYAVHREDLMPGSEIHVGEAYAALGDNGHIIVSQVQDGMITCHTDDGPKQNQSVTMPEAEFRQMIHAMHRDAFERAAATTRRAAPKTRKQKFSMPEFGTTIEQRNKYREAASALSDAQLDQHVEDAIRARPNATTELLTLSRICRARATSAQTRFDSLSDSHASSRTAVSAQEKSGDAAAINLDDPGWVDKLIPPEQRPHSLRGIEDYFDEHATRIFHAIANAAGNPHLVTTHDPKEQRRKREQGSLLRPGYSSFRMESDSSSEANQYAVEYSMRQVTRHGFLDAHLSYFRVGDEGRGKFATKFYRATEKMYRALTANLPAEEKKKACLSLLADVDVGKYYWATQGYSYASLEDRAEHMASIMRGIRVMKESLSSVRFRAEPRWGGELLSLADVGVTGQSLQQWMDAMDELGDDIEPIDILTTAPIATRAIYTGDGVPTSIGKLVMMEGVDWNGRKLLHPVEQKDVETQQTAEMIRHLTKLARTSKTKGSAS